jgi:hypothetical protein
MDLRSVASEESTRGENMRIQSALTLCLAMASFASVAAETPAVEVGTSAPELKLAAADGTSRSLAAADETTVLVFYRGLW